MNLTSLLNGIKFIIVVIYFRIRDLYSRVFGPTNKKEAFKPDEPTKPERELTDFSNTDHVGWLYKDGDSDYPDNYMLFYSRVFACFFVVPIVGDGEKIDLELDNPQEGNVITIGELKYSIHIWTEQE